MNKRAVFKSSNHRARFSISCLACALALVSSAAGQNKTPEAKETSDPVHVRLSLVVDRSVFRIGESVRLVLSFTAERGGYYLNTTTKPTSLIDEVIVSPMTGVNRWLDEYSYAGRYEPDYASIAELSAKPVQVELARLVARYATRSIYNELMMLYREYGAKWSADARGSLLGYFAKYDEAAALPLIEETLDETRNGQDLTILSELTRAAYIEGISALLRRRLEGDDPRAAATAA
jgi:hypothetical protein